MTKSFFFLASFLLTFQISASAQQSASEQTLSASYDLGIERAKQPQEFMMQSQVWKMGPDGKRLDTTTYTVHLRSAPVSEGDEFTCVRFTLRFGNKNEIAIPSLAGWKYVYRRTSNY